MNVHYKNGIESETKLRKSGIMRNFTPGSGIDVLPKTGWSIKAGQGVSKTGRRDIAVEIGTVPPKAGRLTRMRHPAIAAGGRSLAAMFCKKWQHVRGQQFFHPSVLPRHVDRRSARLLPHYRVREFVGGGA